MPPECESITESDADAAAGPRLQAMLLQQSDYPAGYRVSPPQVLDSGSVLQNAINPQQVQQVGGIPIPGVIDVSLGAVKDADRLHRCFAALSKQAQSILADLFKNETGSDIRSTATEISVPKIGDEALGLKLTLQGQQGSISLSLSGYIVIWRHGRIFGSVSVFGFGPNTDNPDLAVQLARKQDSKLTNLP